MWGQTLTKAGHPELLSACLDTRNMMLLSQVRQLSRPSTFGVTIGKQTKQETETVENDVRKPMIETMWQSLSVLVDRETEKGAKKARTNPPGNVPNSKEHSEEKIRNQTIVSLSQSITDCLDTASNSLSPDELDDIVRGCLLETYRLPLIANGFPTETAAFYDWWRCRIKNWIGSNEHHSSGGSYRRLGWRHLAAMIQETRDHLRPPPVSILVRGAGSKVVNGEYHVSSGYGVSRTVGREQSNHRQQQQQQHSYRYYSASPLTYEKPTPDGRTLSLCLCRVDQSPTSTIHNDRGHRLWFLTELDEEQPHTDCDIDYYCALPRGGKACGLRTNPIPPVRGYKRCCPHGVFPPPTLVPIGAVGNAEGSDEDTNHWQNLTRWILDEDVLATCGWHCNYQNRAEWDNSDGAVNAGIAAVLGLVVEVYEEGIPGTNNTAMGTELIVKFAAACLQGPRRTASER